MIEWLPYASLPPEMKDGRVVMLADEDIGVYPMFWNPRGYNMIFSGRKVGIWQLVGGGLTWVDENPDGAPTFWRLPTEQEAADLSKDRAQSAAPQS